MMRDLETKATVTFSVILDYQSQINSTTFAKILQEIWNF